MARLIEQRLILEGELRFTTPLSLAGAKGGIAVDILVMRNGAGNPCIPGTSIAGVVRNYFLQNGESEIWGGIEDGFGASLLRIDDAEMLKASASAVEVRDHVVIDRETGGATEGLKFNREIIPAGARFKLRLVADVPRGQAEALHDVLLSIKAALQGGRMSFGGSTSRGLGRAFLEGGEITAIPLANRDGFLQFLLDGKATDSGLPVPGVPLQAPAELIIAAKLIPLGPIMVKSAVDGLSVDALPLLSKTGDGKRQVIPGASLKGVLRSLAERIMRTLFYKDVPKGGKPSENMLKLLGDEADELVVTLFGRPRPDDETQNGLGRGAVSVDDIYATDKVNEAAWFKRLDPDTKNLPSDGTKYEAANHVAIDRWTGGAADAKLYSAVEPWDISLGSLEIRVSARRLKAARGKEKAALALLELTLREFTQNCPGIGFGTTRGYGQVQLAERTQVVEGEIGRELFDGVGLQVAWTNYLNSRECP